METNFIKTFNEGSWLIYTLIIIGCILLGLIFQWVFFQFLKANNRRKSTFLKEQLIEHLNIPSKILIPILLIYITLSFLKFKVWGEVFIEALIIINSAWLLIAFLQALEKVLKQKFYVEREHKAKERKIITQFKFIKNIGYVVIITLTIAIILWNINEVREIGKTILTSAGVIGIIAGVAAQKSIANLISGFQIALTQPIKIDDEVVVEGEFGTIEDITLTYVVVKTWDWRRLILPLNYFNEKPFTNWTFRSKEHICSVFFYVDYTFPVEELRAEFFTILNENPLWDKNIATLLVTNTDNRTMEIRATFSVKNPSDAWNLRCSIREQLIKYIQENYPETLPKIRKTTTNKMC